MYCTVGISYRFVHIMLPNYVADFVKMVDQEIKREYYTEIDDACRVLYQLELDIDPEDKTPLSMTTEEERIANKAYQRAFWFKFNPDILGKDLYAYTGRDFALKAMCSNGNTTAYENWMNYPDEMQHQFQSKLEEITSTKDLWEKRINPVCRSRCDRCKNTIVELTKCSSCKYGRYCSVSCWFDDRTTHKPVCNFLVKYLNWKRRYG
jgi:hypothetical protein